MKSGLREQFEDGPEEVVQAVTGFHQQTKGRAKGSEHS
jgi:hypothetical protein